MAFIPTEWKNGDIITAEKLNNGIGSKIIIATINSISFVDNKVTGRCEYSFQELKNYIQNGYFVMFYSSGYLSNPASIFEDEESVVIAAQQLVYTSGFVYVTITYDENELLIQQDAINN